MFKAAGAKKALDNVDFSQQLRNREAFQFGHLTDLALTGEVTAHAYDAVQSLLAVGTANGQLVVFGAPGVQMNWDLGRPLKIKHMAFRAGSGILVVCDSKDTLSIYDLSRLDIKGKPVRDSSLSMRSVVTCLEVPTSHSFIFCGGKDGTVDVFDLDRGVLASQARIPNLWLAQEEILRRSGVADAPSWRHIPVCTDVKAHPLDLNLLLIAYEGGVSLWNIAQRHAERNWEFVIPPGAPGGGNDPEEVIFTERRPAVCCLAWRPDGLMFAVGHEDGTLSFACVSDENPLAMRTLERADVNKATEESLFSSGSRKPAGREPVFRLAWSGFPEETYYEKVAAGWGGATSPPNSPSPSSSDFGAKAVERTFTRGGTILTVLGGLLPKDPTGIHLLEFPSYVAPPAAASTTGNISSALRNALRDSLQPIHHSLYPTTAPPEDFLLLPRSTPHLGGAYDPTSILITVGADSSLPVLAAPHSQRGFEAWSFPPLPSRPPAKLQLPPALTWSGASTCFSAKLVNVSTLSYQRLLHQYAVEGSGPTLRLPLRGGRATPLMRPSRPVQSPLDNAPSQPRIMVSLHVDLSVQFWDVSDELLLTDGADGWYPRALEHLRIDLRGMLRDPMSTGLDAARLLKERPWELEVRSADMAVETLELAVGLSTGEVLVFRLVYGEKAVSSFQAVSELDVASGEAQDAVGDALAALNLDSHTPSAPPISHAQPERRSSISRRFSLSSAKSTFSARAVPTFEPTREAQDVFTDLAYVLAPNPTIDSFRPVAAFKLPPTLVNGKACLAMSDIGFLAASSEASLVVVDLRGPEVLLFENGASSAESEGKSKGKGKEKGNDGSRIASLTWTICALGADHDRSPRLIVTYATGLTRIFELAQVAGSWLLASSVPSTQHETTASAFTSFVLDSFGSIAAAAPMQLQRALAQQANFEQGDVDGKGALTSLWVTVTPSAVAAYVNVDGARTALFEGEGFVAAQVATRRGMPVLAVVARNQNIVVLSLPDLVPVTRLTFGATLHSEVGEVSISQDGDLLQMADPFTIKLHTIFDINRAAYPPAIVVHRPEIPVPAQASALTAVKSTFAGFFGGQKMYSPGEIESILGGPDRPPPKQRGGPVPSTRASRAQPAQRSAAEHVQEAASSTVSMLAQTQQALQERGEHLGYLQERLGAMANDAAKFASDAAKSAKQEAAKATLKNSVMGYLGKW